MKKSCQGCRGLCVNSIGQQGCGLGFQVKELAVPKAGTFRYLFLVEAAPAEECQPAKSIEESFALGVSPRRVKNWI